jgi:uncharacterized membrane protein (UPF0182 family)
MPEYSIVGAAGAKQEFNGNQQPKVRYTGSGGVPLTNLFTRLAFAAHYKQGNFVLNNAASAKGARIIFDRDPRQMVQKVAPYLKVDGDPYPIVDQQSGDIVWMVDGYTTISNYPYSQRQSLSSLTGDSLSVTNKTAQQPNDTVNYIRNSVKATVDAFTGKVTLYAWEPNDPVLRSWEKIFPKTVIGKNQMPASILAHVRYPEDLFKVQRAMLGTYHKGNDNPVVFYNVGDKWTVPRDPTNDAGSQPPYYVLAAPPTGGTNARFQLTSPMSVNNLSYLAAYVSADSDPGPDYGKITVLRLPKGQSVVQGPEQIYNTITANGTIRRDTLNNSSSSNVLHGNLLTLPLGNTFLYVEPLYLQSNSGSGGTYPSLQRVILYYGDRIGYGPTLADAFSDFAPGATTGHTVPGLGTGASGSQSGSPSPSPSSPSSAPPPPSTGSVTLKQIDQAVVTLHNAYGSGDAAKIGAAEQQLYELVQRYNAQRSPSTPAKPSGSASTTGAPGSG